MNGGVQAADYVALLEAVKAEFAGSRVRAARAVNAKLIGMYWRIGALILERQAVQGWGARVIERLDADLRASFPNAPGLERRNLHYMRAFAEAWPEDVPPVAQIPWGHVRVLPDRLDDHAVREWCAARDAADGWSRAVLETMLANRLHLRQNAPSNFPATLPGADSALVQEITRDPYVIDFVRWQPGYRELDVQAALVAELRRGRHHHHRAAGGDHDLTPTATTTPATTGDDRRRPNGQWHNAARLCRASRGGAVVLDTATRPRHTLFHPHKEPPGRVTPPHGTRPNWAG